MYKYRKAKQILEKYGQEQLLYFYNELEKEQKEKLINQILKLDFEKIIKLYKNSYTSKNFEVDIKDISPIKHFEKELMKEEVLEEYRKIGEESIRKNEVAVVTMAGGQGSRLGYKGPKGTYELEIDEKKISLYEILCNDLKRINIKYDISVYWYIMTSIENNDATIKYFEEHNYFNYPKENIKFFKQGNLPLIKIDGKLFLQEPYVIKEASNGNGDVFKSLKKAGLISQMEKNKIKYVSFGGIDNILLKNIDPLFLGMMIKEKYQIASKSIFKENPVDNIAIYCLKKNRPAILDYDDITEEMSLKKLEDGTFCYREANMVSHIMTLNAIKDASKLNLPYHRAFKKNAFVNEEGMKQVPDNPNSFKFESFIFDIFYYFDKMLLLRVNEQEEFAPIKSFNGPYNPDVAIEKYKRNRANY